MRFNDNFFFLNYYFKFDVYNDVYRTNYIIRIINVLNIVALILYKVHCHEEKNFLQNENKSHSTSMHRDEGATKRTTRKSSGWTSIKSLETSKHIQRGQLFLLIS